MGICISVIHPKCLWCEKSLSYKGPIILYSFQGCGKYHNKTMCNICLSEKLGYTIEKSDYDIDLSTGDNDDPLGMKIYVKKRLNILNKD